MMTSTNNVPISITEADLTAINTSIQTLQTKLLPYLATLSADERMGLPKMGDKTVSFVQKSLEYCQKNPDLVPPYIDVAGLSANTQTCEQIRTMFQPLLQITDSLWDTLILTGSEAYSESLKFYNSVKLASKAKVQKAETIYNDLSVRFPGRPKKADPGVTTESKTQVN
jgi:hypothetical protein